MVAAAPSWSICVANVAVRRQPYSFDPGASGSFSVVFRRVERRRGFGFSSAGGVAAVAISSPAFWSVSVLGAAFLRGALCRFGFSSGSAAGEAAGEVASAGVSTGGSVVFLRVERRRGFGSSATWSVAARVASVEAVCAGVSWVPSGLAVVLLRGARFRFGFSSDSVVALTSVPEPCSTASAEASTGGSVDFLRGARRRGFGFTSV